MANNKVMSATKTADEKKKDITIVNDNQIEEKAKKILRIGGRWYKKAIDPLTKQETRYQILASMIIADEGKEVGNLILQAAPKYLAETNIPSHIDYQECIDNGDGELFYNIYRPLSHTPTEGEWKHIEKLLRHIFQEQYEMGLDYIQIMYEQPLHNLPILLLVSNETGTGKSTLCKFLNYVFCDNALPLTPEIVESRFNSFWVGKLIGYIEEQAEDSKERRQQTAKVKNIVTAETLPRESKGKDPTLAYNFLKIIICSNDENTPVKIDANDTRYWVRKVPILSKEEEAVDILEECKKEIPAFLYMLRNRKKSTERQNRLWFSPKVIQTDAWKKIVEASKSTLERGIIAMIEEIMMLKGTDKVLYSISELYSVLITSEFLSDKDRRNFSRVSLRDMLRNWGLNAPRRNIRHNVNQIIDGKISERYVSSKAITFTRQELKRIKCE